MIKYWKNNYDKYINKRQIMVLKLNLITVFILRIILK